MILTRVVPVPRGEDGTPGPVTRVDTASPRARVDLAGLYALPAVPWLRVNSVLSVGGSVTGPDGGSDSLSSPADRLLMGAVRSLADVVLSGAASIRREGLHLPKRARLAIVTATGDLGGIQVPEDLEEGRVLVLCPPGSARSVRENHPNLRAEIVPITAQRGAAGERMPATSIVDALHARGLARIVCEGGPTLVAALLEADLVDELCLTTSPVLTPAHSPLVPAEGSGDAARWPLELAQLLADERGTLFARWLVDRGPAAEEVRPAACRPCPRGT